MALESRHTRNISVLLADDHPVFLTGLKTVLNQPGITVVGEAGNGREALLLAIQLRPDVVLLDVRMPDMDGLEALGFIKASFPQTAVVIMTAYDEQAFLWEAFRRGAAGFFLKLSSQKDIADLVRDVAAGDMVLSESMFMSLLKLMEKVSRETLPSFKTSRCELTAQEWKVLEGMAEGFRNQEIATNLSVEPSTIKTHINHLFRKLDVSDRTQALLWAAAHGVFRKRSAEANGQTPFRR